MHSDPHIFNTPILICITHFTYLRIRLNMSAVSAQHSEHLPQIDRWLTPVCLLHYLTWNSHQTPKNPTPHWTDVCRLMLAISQWIRKYLTLELAEWLTNASSAVFCSRTATRRVALLSRAENSLLVGRRRSPTLTFRHVSGLSQLARKRQGASSLRKQHRLKRHSLDVLHEVTLYYADSSHILQPACSRKQWVAMLSVVT